MPPQGFPPQSWQQPPRQPPPRKKRTGLVIGVIAAVVVLTVGGVFGKLYLDYTDQPGGGPGETPVAQCEISSELQARARVSSFRLAGAPAGSGMKHSNCFWEQTAGKDGKDTRKLNIHVYDFRDVRRDAQQQAENSYEEHARHPLEGDKAKPVDGLGDEATFIAPGAKTDLTEVDLVVRKGEVVYLIKYSGHDKGFFTDSEFPASDAEEVARRTAEELIAR